MAEPALSEIGHPERYFYHSFPRRGRATDDEVAKGCKILSLIADAGLLLAPQVMTWKYPHADGSPPREQSIIQRRVCFTELAPAELVGHAKAFGSFSIEFEVATLKRMGAMPAFYIPQAVEVDPDGRSSLGSTLVIQAMDAMWLALRLETVGETLAAVPPDAETFECTLGFQTPKTFRFNIAELRTFVEAFFYALTPPQMLRFSLEALLSSFCPADSLRDGGTELDYYREREWRIAWNFAHKGEEMMARPSPELIDRLLEIDADFFGKPIETPQGTRRFAEEAYVYPRLGEDRIIQLARRVIVPRPAMGHAADVLARFAPAVPVVCIEELAPASAAAT
jgi:hypothetical protein